MSISMQRGWHVTSMWTLRCRGWLVARSIVAMPLLTIPSSTISETWPFLLLTISKLNWMSSFPVMSFRVKSLLNCSFFLLYTSPSARSFLCSTEVLRLFFPPNRSVCVGVKPPLSRTVSAVRQGRWFAKRRWDNQHLQRWSPVTEAFTSRTSFFDSRSGGTQLTKLINSGIFQNYTTNSTNW